MKFKEAYKKAKEVAKERKFKQSVELIFNLTGIDKKKFALNDSIKLPHGRGKPLRICVVGTGDFVLKGKKTADKTIDKDEFTDFKNKAEIKKLAKDIDFFVVEASVMADFAKTFGQVLGPIGKMPLPHHIVAPRGDPVELVTNLRKTVRIKAKKTNVIQIVIGSEELSDKEVEENFKSVLEFVLHKLERGRDNVKNVMVKLTMGPAVKING